MVNLSDFIEVIAGLKKLSDGIATCRLKTSRAYGHLCEFKFRLKQNKQDQSVVVLKEITRLTDLIAGELKTSEKQETLPNSSNTTLYYEYKISIILEKTDHDCLNEWLKLNNPPAHMETRITYNL